MLDDMSLLLLYSLQYLRKDLSEVSSPIQTKNIPSMNLDHRTGLCLYLCSQSCSKHCWNYDINILAQLTAIGVPIALPLIWWKNRPLNDMTLHFSISSINFTTTLVGNDWLLLLSKTWLQASTPSLWSMFGYNDCTSVEAIKSFSFGHSGINLRPLILLIKSVVSWM